MKNMHNIFRPTAPQTTLIAIGVLVAAGTAVYFFWTPLRSSIGRFAGTADSKHDSDHDAGAPGAVHSHPVPEDANSLELSESAQRSIGLKTKRLQLQSFEKTVSVPAIVAERPGRSQIDITAPLTGNITKVYPIEGEAVEPGQKLFEIRLTHEELVVAQRDFLQSAEQLDVINQDITRLESAGQGIVAGKTILERKYEQQKTEALLRAQKQGLLLHGLSNEQVESILTSRNLLQSLTVTVPPHEDSSENCNADHLFHIHQLNIKPGQHVDAGTSLCVLADHCQLFIEGTAFDQDIERLHRVVNENRELSASLSGEGPKNIIPGLKILYLSDQVEPVSRAMHFYVQLPNELVRNTNRDGHRFIVWRFKPGQRMQLHVPIERWTDKIVLPADAVAQDGVESYVFLANGDHFDRHTIHVEYRDQFSVVVANDGSVFPGDNVVITGAQQLQLALKNKSGGGVDPHAGHHH